MTSLPTTRTGGDGQGGSLSAMFRRGEGLEVVEQRQLFRRFLVLWNRTVRLPSTGATTNADGDTETRPPRTVDWDIVGSPAANIGQPGMHAGPTPCFCTVFIFDTMTKTTTLLLEYMQGINAVRYGLV
ncbi:hypothetical protein HK405_014375, partial [Cladochytrium tenue]